MKNQFSKQYEPDIPLKIHFPESKNSSKTNPKEVLKQFLRTNETSIKQSNKMKRCTTAAPFLFWVFCTLAIEMPHAAAQAIDNLFKFQSFTTKHGLPASEALAFSEDKNGFLWIATTDGVSRFDGFKFKNYNLPIVNSDQVSGSNRVFAVLCMENQIWCINSLGQLFQFDHREDTFSFLSITFQLAVHTSKEKYDSAILACIDTSRNCLWVVDNLGIWKVNLIDNQKELFLEERFKITGKLLIDRNGQLWFSSNSGKVCFNPKTREKKIFFEAFNITSSCLKGSKVCFLSTALDTLYFIDTQNYKIDKAATDVKYFFRKRTPDCIQDMIEPPPIFGDSLLYLSTCDLGLITINFFTGKFIANYNTDNHEALGFAHDWVSNLFRTSDNCIWLATQKGIQKIDARQQFFYTTKIPEFKTQNLPRIRHVITDFRNKNRKWVATGEGLFLWDAHKKIIANKFLQPSEKTTDSKSWARINCMKKDNKGQLWLGTDGGLAVLDSAENLHKSTPKMLNRKKIVEFEQVEKDAFWIKGLKDAGLFYPKRGQYFPIHFPQKKDNQPLGIFNVNIGLEKSALFSTDSAVYRVKLSDFDSGCQCFPKPGLLFKLLNPTDLIENDTAIWVILPSGLGKFDKKLGNWQIFGKKEGLSNLRVRSILADSEGKFWMNSDNGLFVFHPQYSRFKKFGEDEGLADNFLAGVLSDDGDEFHAGFQYAFSTIKSQFTFQETTLKPLITDVFVLNKRLSFSDENLPAFIIKHSQNIIHFEFTCPDFYQSEKITFQYQLEGFDTEPIAASTNRSAVYTNLDGGHYRFLVWAINADGFRCKTPAVLSFHVLPPFYLTWWFMLLSMAALALVIWLVFQYQLRQSLEKERFRQQIARDLHDEVGSTLSTISFLSEAASHAAHEDFEKTRLAGIGEKTRSAMESISDIVWAVNPMNDEMPKIIQRMTVFAAETLEAVGIELKFSAEPEVERLRLPIDVRKDFYLIFKEAVANCAKHSRANHASIFLKKDNGWLVFELSDDGVGLPKDSKNRLGGNGLKNMSARAAGFGGEFLIENGAENGAMVRLRVPV